MFRADVHDPSYYIDRAFRRAKEAALSTRKSLEIKGYKRYQIIEISRLNTIYQVVKTDLKRILDEFPPLESLPEFYQELISLVVDYKKVKEACRRLTLIIRLLNEWFERYKNKIKGTRDPKEMARIRREFYGRVASLLKRNKEYFEILREASKKLRNLPVIKNYPTVVIAGLPNVGKSTLLKKLTDSKPEIQPYPFTTKGLMIGYIETPYTKIQIIDTPGILDRPFDQMNNIEKQAVLAIKKLAHLIIYIFDATETCGFPIEDQEKLFNQLKETFNLNKENTIIYFSKTDIFKEEDWSKYSSLSKKYKEFKQFTDSNKLKEYLFQWVKKRKDLWI